MNFYQVQRSIPFPKTYQRPSTQTCTLSSSPMILLKKSSGRHSQKPVKSFLWRWTREYRSLEIKKFLNISTHLFSSRKSAMLRLLLENSITPISSVQDLWKLNCGYQRMKSNNKRKPRKTEKSIKFLTKSSRELETWVLDPKLHQDRSCQEVHHSHNQEYQVVTDNTHNNTLKEEATVWEEEEVQEVKVQWEEVACNLCTWDNTSKVNKECHSQDKCHNKWDHLSLNNSQAWHQFLKSYCHKLILPNTTAWLI